MEDSQQTRLWGSLTLAPIITALYVSPPSLPLSLRIPPPSLHLHTSSITPSLSPSLLPLLTPTPTLPASAPHSLQILPHPGGGTS